MRKLWDAIRWRLAQLRIFSRLNLNEQMAMHCTAVLNQIGYCEICGFVKTSEHLEMMLQGKRARAAVCSEGSCKKKAKAMGWMTKEMVEAKNRQRAARAAKEAERNDKDRKAANAEAEHQASEDGRQATDQEAVSVEVQQEDPAQAAVEASTQRELGDRP